MSPDLRAGRTEALMTKDNHLEWVCELSAGEQRDLLIKWSMEFPLNESVVYSTTIGGNGGAMQVAHANWTQHSANSNNYCQLMGSQQRVY